MSTVQVEERVKKQLFAVAAELQRKLGKKISLNEAIEHLLASYRRRGRDVQPLLSLFGSLGPAPEGAHLLHRLRREDEKRLERITRKHSP